MVTLEKQTTILEQNMFYTFLRTLRNIMQFSGATVTPVGQNQALANVLFGRCHHRELSNLIPAPDLTVERWWKFWRGLVLFKHFGTERLSTRFGDNGHLANELQEAAVWKYLRYIRLTELRSSRWSVHVCENWNSETFNSCKLSNETQIWPVFTLEPTIL